MQQIRKLRFRAAEWLAQIQPVVVHDLQLLRRQNAANPNDLTSWPPLSFARKEQSIQVVKWDIVHLNGESRQ